MKSAEEWMKEWVVSYETTPAVIRAIQADAIRHASALCQQYYDATGLDKGVIAQLEAEANKLEP